MHLAGRRFTAYLRGERDRAAEQTFPVFDMGVKRDDFEPDLLRRESRTRRSLPARTASA
jgi:hypothetical protein